MQLYLGCVCVCVGGYMGSLPAWIRAAKIIGITLQAERGKAKVGHFA